MRSTAVHPFRRRHYRSAAQLWHDLRQLAALRAQPHAAVSPALRERLMLVVTSVNQCRYCAAFHTRAAQLSGLMPDEIALLLGGDLQHAPAPELHALLYAHGWAAADGAPERREYARLVTIYGPDQAAGIELVLRAIRIGNLLGNTGDYLLFRLSGGRLVIEEPDFTRFAVKLVALAERLALMGSSFSAPAEICAMVVAHGAQARIASDGGFAAWVVAEKPV